MVQFESIVRNGRRLHFVATGDGPPVVLVHGLGASWRWWQRNIGPLAREHRVYALDLGRREDWLRGRDRVRPTEAADVLGDWFAAMGLQGVRLIGHSMGGLMAVQLTAARPALVERLVLVDAAVLPFAAGLGRLTLRAIGPVPERTLEFTRLVVGSAIRTNPLVILKTAREMLSVDGVSAARAVRCPTLIVWGERDPMVPISNAYRLQATIPGSRLVIVPGSGHNPMYYRAEIFNRVVLEFLRAGQSTV